MTASEVLDLAAVAGIEVFLREDGTPTIRGGTPNAALMAALKEHRAAIIELLGGERQAEWCGVRPDPTPKHPDRVIVCNSWVFEAVDSENFCRLRGCPFRARARKDGSE